MLGNETVNESKSINRLSYLCNNNFLSEIINHDKETFVDTLSNHCLSLHNRLIYLIHSGYGNCNKLLCGSLQIEERDHTI